ncbi:MAG: HAD family phosphatase [Candidatus Aenigmatarchaeota archaeon]
MIKAIIFDFGGVCFYPGTTNQLLLEALFNSKISKIKILSLLLNFKKRKKIRMLVEEFNLGKISESVFWKKIKKVTGYDFDETELKKEIISLNKPIEPVINIIKNLKKNYKLGLLTNNNAWLEEINKKYDFYKYFDVVINSCDVGISKPNKEIYIMMLERINAKPKECIFIDDKKKNVEAAIKLGINGIVYKNPKQLLLDLKKLGVKI